MIEIGDGVVRTDEETEGAAGEDAAEAGGLTAQPRKKISMGYVLTMDEEAIEPLRLSDYVEGAGADLFILAKEASPQGESRIRKAAGQAIMDMPEGANRKAKRAAAKGRGVDGAGPTKVAMDLAPGASFVQKCIEQIVDYALPSEEIDKKTGEKKEVTRHFDPVNKGKNEYNKETYWVMMRPHLGEFQELVERYLDMAAGRDIETQEDLADLGNAQ